MDVITQAWGSYLKSDSWKWFVTLTMGDREDRNGRKYTPGIYLARNMWKEFVGNAWLSPHLALWFAVFECGKWRKAYHIHALCSAFDYDISELTARQAGWGFSKCIPFIGDVGASGYLGKYFFKDDSEFDCSERFERGER